MSAQESEELKVLREILRWTKFAGMGQVKMVLETVLNNDRKKLAYQLSDGTRGTREVNAQSGYTGSVSDLWKEWKRKGIGDTISVQRGERFKRTFDLEEFGIDFPQPIAQQAQPAQPATPAPSSPQQNLTTNVVGSS